MDTEFWMRGPVENIPALLQPVAHTLLQARAEINRLMMGFPEEQLWDRPSGVASPGFHLKHLAGVLDRLFTYAKGNLLTPEQMEYLKSEDQEKGTLEELLDHYNAQTNLALEQLSSTNESTLTDFRGIGRKQLPSTVQGLLFHAAEHTMRHTGQLLVTVRVLCQP
ncbi:DinB family protein [Chitinophaga sp. Hz27]|uniref:DinB family protein n=1 Tax=Chitinophaga sp. Hz27 TaxID=3347169 RepID=UPI0035E2217F